MVIILLVIVLLLVVGIMFLLVKPAGTAVKGGQSVSVVHENSIVTVRSAVDGNLVVSVAPADNDPGDLIPADGGYEFDEFETPAERYRRRDLTYEERMRLTEELSRCGYRVMSVDEWERNYGPMVRESDREGGEGGGGAAPKQPEGPADEDPVPAGEGSVVHAEESSDAASSVQAGGGEDDVQGDGGDGEDGDSPEDEEGETDGGAGQPDGNDGDGGRSEDSSDDAGDGEDDEDDGGNAAESSEEDVGAVSDGRSVPAAEGWGDDYPEVQDASDDGEPFPVDDYSDLAIRLMKFMTVSFRKGFLSRELLEFAQHRLLLISPESGTSVDELLKMCSVPARYSPDPRIEKMNLEEFDMYVRDGVRTRISEIVEEEAEKTDVVPVEIPKKKSLLDPRGGISDLGWKMLDED